MPTPWEVNFRDTNSQGVIQGTPAQAFRYSYTFLLPITVGGLSLGLGEQSVSGEWHFQLQASDGTVLFEQDVKIKGMALNLYGLVYTFLLESITQTTTLPGQTPVVITGGGSSSPVGLGVIWDEPPMTDTPTWGLGDYGMWGLWYSPIYTVPLPAGAKVYTVPYNTLDAFGVKHEAYQFAVEAGAQWAVARSPEHGYFFTAQCVSDGIQIRAGGDKRSFDTGATGAAAFPWAPGAAALTAPIQAKIPAVGASSPILVRLPHHRVGWLCLWQEGGNLKLAASYENTQGESWSDPMDVLSGYTPVAAAVTPEGGGLLVIASNAGDMVGVVLPLSYKDSVLGVQDATPSPLTLVDGSPLPTISGQAWLNFAGAQVLLSTTSGSGLTIYSSSDGGRTWAQ
jgi:hypothetical protein